MLKASSTKRLATRLNHQFKIKLNFLSAQYLIFGSDKFLLSELFQHTWLSCKI